MDSIYGCKTLDEITAMRRESYERQKANGDNYEGVLVGIYEKPTHFVYELLQNADDALATKVNFELKENELIFRHNGTKDFSINDIISITGVGNSTKKNGSTVGKFGVGFKSVFSITRTPYIYNRAYNFYIEHLTIPHATSATNLGEYTTVFKLPFNGDKYTPEALVEKIRAELESLDSATIMFLKNISTLEVVDFDSEKFEIELVREKMDGYELVRDLASNAEYHVFSDTETHVSIAYAVEDDKIVPLDYLYLYSYLPTRVETALKFYVDAPFALATTREAIDFDATENRAMLGKIADLFVRTLESLRDEGYLDQDFLNNVLPVSLEDCDQPLYKELYEKLKISLKSMELLPLASGGFTTVEGAQLYSDHEMVKLDAADFRWLDINTARTRIRGFLARELDVIEVSALEFAQEITEKSLKSKNNEWLIEFYAFCSDHVDWYSDRAWKHLPFIKTRTGEFKSAFVGEEEQVFRPSSGLEDNQIINSLFLNRNLDEKVREKLSSLISDLGIKERTPRQTVAMTLLPGWEEADLTERLAIFRQMAEIYRVTNEDDRHDIVRLLEDEEIFLCDNGSWTEWRKGADTMRGTEAQRRVFKNGMFLRSGLWDDATEELCRALGVEEGLPIVMTRNTHLNYNFLVPNEYIEKYRIPTEIYPRWWLSEYYDVPNFEDALADFGNFEDSAALVELLRSAPVEYLKDEVSGTYGGNNAYSPHTRQRVPARFLRTLEKTAWIFHDGAMHKPYEFSAKEFTEMFSLDGDEAFLPLLGLRPDFLEDLPVNERRGAKLFSDCTEEEMAELERLKEKMRRKKGARGGSDDSSDNDSASLADSADFVDSEDSTEVVLAEFPALDGEIIEDALSDASLSEAEILGADRSGVMKHENLKTKSNNVSVEEDISDDAEGDSTSARSDSASARSDDGAGEPHHSTINSQEALKALGDLGEAKINDVLISKYGEEQVKWFGEMNKGYDFAIARGGEDQLYIEVKTTSGRKDEGGMLHIPITPAEWNMAKIKGEKYQIYLLNATTGHYRVIKNPYQAYLENKIGLEAAAVIVPEK